jgi:hypothetical protein
LFELEEYCRLNNSVFAVIKHLVTSSTFLGGIGFMEFARYGIPDKVLNDLAADLANREPSSAKSECYGMDWICPNRWTAKIGVTVGQQKLYYENGICPECIKKCELFDE